MPLILNIDTSTSNASICLAEGSECLFESSNDVQKEHAGWLHPAIKQALSTAGKKVNDLEAVAVTAGPGSYTGLRVSLAAAKGLCYALDIPLIAVNTLEAMASMAVNEVTDYICPMIDAKRMEVFAALYDKNLLPIIEPAAIILDKNAFSEYLSDKTILFFGNGKNKFEQIAETNNALFKNLIFNASHLSAFTYSKYLTSDFSSVYMTDPVYIKEYYTLFISKS